MLHEASRSGFSKKSPSFMFFMLKAFDLGLGLGRELPPPNLRI